MYASMGRPSIKIVTVRDLFKAGDVVSGSLRRRGITLPAIPCSFRRGEPRRLQHRVGRGIARGDEPPFAAQTVIPPFALWAGHIGALVEIRGPVVRRSFALWPLAKLAAEPEFVDPSRAAVGARYQE